MKIYFLISLLVVFIFQNTSAIWKDEMGNYLSGNKAKISPRFNVSIAFSIAPTEKLNRPQRLQYLLDKFLSSQIENSWNPGDSSKNFIVKESDPLTCRRNPVIRSTDGIRGKVGYTKGLHVWELQWSSNKRGQYAVVGVATADAPLHVDGYQLLLGSDQHGWGWAIGTNKIYHSSEINGVVYPTLFNPAGYKVPEKFLVVLDMDHGTLAFDADNQYLGVAFTGLQGKKLFPAISSVFGDSEITIRYIGGLDPMLYCGIQ